MPRPGGERHFRDRPHRGGGADRRGRRSAAPAAAADGGRVVHGLARRRGRDAAPARRRRRGWPRPTRCVRWTRDADGGLTVALPVASERWLERLLLRVGPEAEVVAPGRAGRRGPGRGGTAAGALPPLGAHGGFARSGVQRGAVVGDAGLGEQVGQGSGGRLGVGQGVVRPAAGDAVARADVVERVARWRSGSSERDSSRVQSCGAAGASRRAPAEGPARGRPSRTGRGGRRARPRSSRSSELGGHGAERGRPPDPAPRDAVQPPWADPPRPDIGAPAVDHGAVAQHGDDGDLDDAVAPHRQPTRLDVDHGEALAGQRWRRLWRRWRGRRRDARRSPYAGGAREFEDRRRRPSAGHGSFERPPVEVVTPEGDLAVTQDEQPGHRQLDPSLADAGSGRCARSSPWRPGPTWWWITQSISWQRAEERLQHRADASRRPSTLAIGTLSYSTSSVTSGEGGVEVLGLEGGDELQHGLSGRHGHGRYRCDLTRTSTPLRRWSTRARMPSPRGRRRAGVVTRAAIGLRSERVRVMWANSGWPRIASITDTTPSWRPTRRLSRWATSWVSTTRLPCAQAAERGEQHRALEVLGLVDDHEAVGEAAAADVGERQHLEQVALEHLVDDLGAHDRLERVGDGRRPRQHLLALAARAGSRAPDRRRRRSAGTPPPACGCAARAPPRARRRAPARSCRCRRCRRATRCRSPGRPAGRWRRAARPSGRARRTGRGRRARGAPACRACTRASADCEPERAGPGRCGRAGRGPRPGRPPAGRTARRCWRRRRRG